jgi:hypothetical protein
VTYKYEPHIIIIFKGKYSIFLPFLGVSSFNLYKLTKSRNDLTDKQHHVPRYLFPHHNFFGLD